MTVRADQSRTQRWVQRNLALLIGACLVLFGAHSLNDWLIIGSERVVPGEVAGSQRSFGNRFPPQLVIAYTDPDTGQAETFVADHRTATGPSRRGEHVSVVIDAAGMAKLRDGSLFGASILLPFGGAFIAIGINERRSRTKDAC